MGILRRREKPKTYHHHPSIVQPSSGIVGNIASSMITGVGLGVGSEVGHQVAKSFISSDKKEEKTCELEKDNFRRCMDNTGNEFKMCEEFFNALKNCK